MKQHTRPSELMNQLGNVRVVVSDRKLLEDRNQDGEAEVRAEVLASYNYYPFGQHQPGRTYEGSAEYRFGFNGKERDQSFGGTVYDYGFRIYNPQIGKFLSVDPLTAEYPWYTPYQFAGNKPIRFIDLDGLEEYDPMQDPFFIPKLVVTGFFDLKHAVFNVAAASKGHPTRARYKRDENGNEIFETEFYEPQQETLADAAKNNLGLALDIATIYGAKGFGAEDFLASRSGSGSQITRAFRTALSGFEQAKRQIKAWPGCDCSEIAEDILDAVGEGQVLRIEGKGERYIKVLEEGVPEQFEYHEVFILEDKVFDPRYSDVPVNKDEYFQKLNEVNEGTELDIKDVTDTK